MDALRDPHFSNTEKSSNEQIKIGQTVNQKYYRKFLMKLVESVRKKQSKSWKNESTRKRAYPNAPSQNYEEHWRQYISNMCKMWENGDLMKRVKSDIALNSESHLCSVV